jgi:hypothetical protein
VLDDFQDELLGGGAAFVGAPPAPPSAPAAAPAPGAGPAAAGAQLPQGMLPLPAAVKPEPQDGLLASLAQLGAQLELELCDSSDSDEDGEGGEPLTDMQRLQKLIAGLAPPPPLKVEQGPGQPDLPQGPGLGPSQGQQPAFDWRSAALLRPLHIKPEPGLLLPPPGNTANPWLLHQQQLQQQPAARAAPGPLYLPAGPSGATIKLEIVQGGGSDSSDSSSGGRPRRHAPVNFVQQPPACCHAGAPPPPLSSSH